MRPTPVLGLITILITILITSLSGLAQQSAVDVKHVTEIRGLQPGTPFVSIPVLVTDVAMHFVTGLDQGNFKVFEGKSEHVITRFSRAGAPLSVGIVFDTSGSMRNKLRRSSEAVSALLKNANPEDEFFLICFGDRAHLTVGLTQEAKSIQSRLAFTRAKGSTALFDGIYMAIDQMKQARNARKALLVIYDGNDNSSQHTEAEVREAARESDVQIYGIGLYEPLPSRAQMPEERSGPGALRGFSEQTGGKDFNVGNLAEMPGIGAKIGLELRNEYVLGYTSKNVVKDGKHREVQVKLVKTVGSPRLTFRTRYYAP